MKADGAVRGVRLEVGRLVPQQQSRHGCSSRRFPVSDSRCDLRCAIPGVQFPVCDSRPGPSALRLRGSAPCGHVTGGGSAAAMATYVSELEAAKKSLSEALGENVKQ